MLYQSPSQNIHSTTGHSSYNNSVQEPTCLLTFAHERGWAITKLQNVPFMARRGDSRNSSGLSHSRWYGRRHMVRNPPRRGRLILRLAQTTVSVQAWRSALEPPPSELSLAEMVPPGLITWSSEPSENDLAYTWPRGWHQPLSDDPDSTANPSFYPCLGDIIISYSIV